MDQPIKPNATLVPKIICGDISLSVRLCRLAWGLTTARNPPAFNGLCTGALGARIDRPGSSDTTVRDLPQRSICPDSAAPTSQLYDLESTDLEICMKDTAPVTERPYTEVGRYPPGARPLFF